MVRPLNTEFAFAVTLEVPPPAQVGPIPVGLRRVSEIKGGRVSGPLLNGRVITGADWLLLRDDGVLEMDARLTLELETGETIGMRYTGVRHGPKEVLDRLAKGEDVDPDTYYFRTVPSFDASSAAFDWLNRTIFVATGTRSASGPTYYVYAIR